jgi:long-chain acyl-CoA synthetase
MHLTQGLRRAAQIGPNRVATIQGDRRRTWAEVLDRVARLAAGLSALGVERGDRVGVLALNSDRYLETYYAIAWAGAVAVPCNTRWSAAEHLYGFRDSGTSLLLVDNTFAPLAAQLAAELPMPLIFMDDGQAPAGTHDYEALIAGHDPIEDRSGRGDDLCGIFYTGGTTGHPKGVMLSHRGFAVNCMTAIAVNGFSQATRYLHAAPMFHMADMTASISVTLAGGSHVLIPMFNPANVVTAFAGQGANITLFVPTMFTMLGEHLDKHPADLSGVERVIYGASPISEALLKRAMAMFPKAEFYQGYGQTELGPNGTGLFPEHHVAATDKPALLRSAGQALPGIDVRVTGENFHELPRGQVGEVLVRHDGIMLGYWNKPDLTAETIVDGWVRTGDAGYMDEEGFLFIVDRVKDMIISGGENIFSAEVENALAQHPSVLECAVIGIPDEKWGESVHGVIRLREGHSVNGDQLIAHCKILIAGYKCPRSIEIRPEPFPMSAAGKILKRELRDSYWQGQTRAVGA